MPPPVTLTSKIKAQLKLAISRLRMIQQRDEASSKAARRAMAQLLEAGKLDSARIRVENIIRSDVLSELHEILELYCELLLARAGLLDSAVCDPGLEEAAKSIVYAAGKTEIKELHTVRLLFGEKYGKEFIVAAMENTDGKVSDKVIRKLKVAPPREELVQGYLEEIAKAYGVNYPRGRLKPAAAVPNDGNAPGPAEEDEHKRDGPGSGDHGTGVAGPAEAAVPADLARSRTTPPGTAATAATPSTATTAVLGAPASSPLTATPPRMTTDNVHPRVTLNSMELNPARKPESGRKRLDDPAGGVEELERRFAALKKL